MELADARFRVRGGPIVHVRERRSQPLEAIPRAWRWLREGRRVYVDAEPGACTQTLALLAEMGEVLGFHVLTTSRDVAGPPKGSVEGGVALAPRRLTLIASQADEELAAYVLARACLRRSGLDPRAVHVAIVSGDGRTLGRMLRRLWLSVRFSEPGDHGAFAGPVSEEVARELELAMERLEGRSDVTCWVPLRRLEGTSETRGCLMAPTLWATSVGLDRHRVEEVMACFPEVGPALLVLRERDASSASRLLFDLVGAGYRWTLVGPLTTPEVVGLREPPLNVFDGALLEERLPPGLPKPRP
jgi:hypothetical protein